VNKLTELLHAVRCTARRYLPIRAVQYAGALHSSSCLPLLLNIFFRELAIIFRLFSMLEPDSSRQGRDSRAAELIVAQLAEAEFYFVASPRLYFLLVPDDLSDDDLYLAGGHLELLRSMWAVASVMRSLSDLSTPCPLHRRQSP